MPIKPHMAFYEFTGCGGDLLQIVDLEEVLLDIVRHVDVESFRKITTGGVTACDIAFVEGSITCPEDEERLKEIRKQSAMLIALGACAATGGINCLTRLLPQSETTAGGNEYPKPLSAIVHVDAALHGCPVDRAELLRVVKDLLLGKRPAIHNSPVCVECKAAGNVCRFDLGKPCLGIITRGGCSAACISEGATCWGCRGLAPGANLDAARAVLLDRYGFSTQGLVQLASLHLSCEAPSLTRAGGAA